MSAPTQEQKDIIEIKGEIERIRHHQELQKKSNETFTTILIEIKNAIKGSDMNGNVGIVDDLREVKKKVDLLENFHLEVEIYVRQFKWFIGVMSAVVVALCVSFIRLLGK
jgi:hypothetical protein